MSHEIEALSDPVAAFIRAATVSREAHNSGTLDEADAILVRHPGVASRNIHTAAILADEARVRAFLAEDPGRASAKGGPDGWDALTHLCFSRYLRLDRSRSDAYVSTARALLDAGANANTGWYETIDHPNPRQVIEAAIYGAAGIAQHAGLTRLLLERGADPNDEETPYHVPETYDNTVLRVLLDSGRFNPTSLSWLLLRKCDWHDFDGLRLVLDRGGDPNAIPRFGRSAFHHALTRDNSIEAIALLLDRGADPALRDSTGRSAIEIAARRGRGDALRLFKERGVSLDLQGIDRLVATCALDDGKSTRTLLEQEPGLKHGLMERGGALLAEFSGTGNVQGVRNLLECGVAVDALYAGDPYFDIAKDSTALHVAAWRASHGVVRALIARGAPVDARDGKGRTPMMLAVKACVDSYWRRLRRPDSVKALLDAGASAGGIQLPCGYDDVDALLMS
ncbi:MAG TPA: ankyrin repeat domain-containing protein [Vicinamibacterales bacterium]|jgi:ankyrin repeat protein|nr:ankyrin repeat domain-containing protein [Vicinamibacterales bacterium]